MRPLTMGLVMMLAVSSAAFSQEAPISTIETEGVAVVDAVPLYVEFWLHARIPSATIAVAIENALRFEPSVRKELESRELKPAELTFSGVAIPNIQAKEAHISARLRFGATAYTGAGEEGPRQFGALCDTILALGTTLSCTAEGPFLGIDDKESIEQASIARATEKAYPAAKAAAQVMNGQIVAVDRVLVESITWNNAPGVNATQPDLRRLTCTAKVSVTYAFTP